MTRKLGLLSILFFLLSACSADLTPTMEPIATTSVTPGGCSGTERESAPPSFDLSIIDLLDPAERNSFISGYLNKYGINEQVLESQMSYFFLADLTNDDNPEIVLISQVSLTYTIFGCLQGEYLTLLNFEAFPATRPGHLEFIADMNQNGTPEIGFNTGYSPEDTHRYKIFEWDGVQFRNIIGDTFIAVYQSGGIKFNDIDENGIPELLVDSGLPPDIDKYKTYPPLRTSTRVFTWDGNQYLLAQEEWAPPEYRFQAVQDADRLFLNGDYAGALAMYQSAISNGSLGGWGEQLALEIYIVASFDNPTLQGNLPDVTGENTKETVSLSAYSYFRMMQIYILQNQPDTADEIFQTIQSKYGTDEYGKPFAEMAAAFWKEYVVSQNIVLACQMAIAYTADHQFEILHYLGDTPYEMRSAELHGIQSLDYTPESVCPVK